MVNINENKAGFGYLTTLVFHTAILNFQCFLCVGICLPIGMCNLTVMQHQTNDLNVDFVAITWVFFISISLIIETFCSFLMTYVTQRPSSKLAVSIMLSMNKFKVIKIKIFKIWNIFPPWLLQFKTWSKFDPKLFDSVPLSLLRVTQHFHYKSRLSEV